MTDYEVLGLRSIATLDEIKKRFHQLVKMNHPDRYDKEADRDLWEFANERMSQITEAYRRLIGEFNGSSTSHHKESPEGESRKTDPISKSDYLLRRKRVELYVNNLRKGESSYEDINDLFSNWLWTQEVVSSSLEEMGRIATSDEVAELIVKWVAKSIQRFGVYTYNEYAITILERLSRGAEIHISDSVKSSVKVVADAIARQREELEEQYGKVVRFQWKNDHEKTHFVKEQIKKTGLRIGLDGQSNTIDNCRFCRNCHMIQKFLHKEWYCDIRSDASSAHGKRRVDPVNTSCLNFERDLPHPVSLSKSKLLRYGIIQYAKSLGYGYVHMYDMEYFGCCNECVHYQESQRWQYEECKLRGRGDGHSADLMCCKSFVPAYEKSYIKIGF